MSTAKMVAVIFEKKCDLKMSPEKEAG